METLLLECQNLECEPDALLVQLEVRTVKLSMWQCPKCRYVYFYRHTEQQLSEGREAKTINDGLLMPRLVSFSALEAFDKHGRWNVTFNTGPQPLR